MCSCNNNNEQNAPLNDGNVGNDSLRPGQRVVAQLCYATMPLFIVTSVFLIVARNLPNHASRAIITTIVQWQLPPRGISWKCCMYFLRPF
jgi:hypothetical protein